MSKEEILSTGHGNCTLIRCCITQFSSSVIWLLEWKGYKLEPHCMTQSLTLGVKGLQVRTTLYDSRFASESERVTSENHIEWLKVWLCEWKDYKLEPHCMAQGLTLGVKGLQVRTTLFDWRFDSGNESVTSQVKTVLYDSRNEEPLELHLFCQTSSFSQLPNLNLLMCASYMSHKKLSKIPTYASFSKSFSYCPLATSFSSDSPRSPTSLR